MKKVLIMLGWEIFITQRDPKKIRSLSRPFFMASWMTSIGGDDWIKDLVKNGLAEDITTNSGYPDAYSVKAKYVLPLISKGAPQYNGTTVIGDDYFWLSGSTKNFQINELEISQCDPEDELLIEAWDQS